MVLKFRYFKRKSFDLKKKSEEICIKIEGIFVPCDFCEFIKQFTHKLGMLAQLQDFALYGIQGASKFNSQSQIVVVRYPFIFLIQIFKKYN